MAYKHFAKKAFILMMFIILGLNTLKAQDQNNPIVTMLKSKDYCFTPQSYSSTTVSMRQITDDYIVRVKADSIIGSIPYYGQSFSPQINVTDGGIKFTSAKFVYSFVEKKKGKCEITISPKDDRNIQELFITVFSDGSAQMQVSSRNREPMTFFGYVSVR